jgi:hypothetical protein
MPCVFTGFSKWLQIDSQGHNPPETPERIEIQALLVSAKVSVIVQVSLPKRFAAWRRSRATGLYD